MYDCGLIKLKFNNFIILFLYSSVSFITFILTLFLCRLLFTYFRFAWRNFCSNALLILAMFATIESLLIYKPWYLFMQFTRTKILICRESNNIKYTYCCYVWHLTSIDYITIRHIKRHSLLPRTLRT